MKALVTILALVGCTLVADYADVMAQQGNAPVQEGNVITLAVQTIRARIRRPTVQLVPERIRPDFSQVSSSVESLSNQVKERPKSDFYIRKDVEFPVQIETEPILKRKRD